MTTVFATFSPVEAAVIQSRLEAAHLHADIQNELSNILFGFSCAPGVFNPACGAILVQVPDDEAHDANEILQSGSTGPDDAPTS